MNMRWLPEELFLPMHRAVDLQTYPSWRSILALVAMKHGVMQRDILGSCRFRHIVAARHEAVLLIFRHTKLSRAAIGRRFGRDHTTVLHVLRKFDVEDRLLEMPPRPQKAVSGRPNYRHSLRGPDGRFLVKGSEPPKSERAKRAEAIREAIREGYAAGETAMSIAARCGSTPGSVRVIAHHMELTSKTKPHLRHLTPQQREDHRVLVEVGRYSSAAALEIVGSRS
ncbi:helix-turn-helix domain-containing protein [Devosia riboflavina]|uniref:helix-turn-helix domain-containing protein n=1 Tax=Devosia riboflavina TaxID=46914 RepID=UPI000A028152|nr:helix-turn-helix domain-containing protein [Devosia riboflavina]